MNHEPLNIIYELLRTKLSKNYAKQTQFQKKSNDVNPYNTTEYERRRDWTLGENKPNSNPIKPNLRKAQMNRSYVKTTNYEQKTMNYANNKQTQFPKCQK